LTENLFNSNPNFNPNLNSNPNFTPNLNSNPKAQKHFRENKMTSFFGQVSRYPILDARV